MKAVDPMRLRIGCTPRLYLQPPTFFFQVSHARVQLGKGVYPLLIIYEGRKNLERRLSHRFHRVDLPQVTSVEELVSSS